MVSLANSPARKAMLLLLCGYTSAQGLHESTTTNAAAAAQWAAAAQPAAAEPSATVAAAVAAAAQPAAAEPSATVEAAARSAAAKPSATVAAERHHHHREHESRTGRWREWRRKPAVRGALLVTAGGLSAAVAKTATAPLERVKLLAQAGQPGNFVQLLAEVVRAEGVRGLWRGNPANIVRVIPNKGVLLMCSDMYKETVRALLPSWGAAAVSSLSGAFAGLTAVLLTYPLELVRTRMAFRICTDEAEMAYRTLGGSLRQVFNQEGVQGLYAGMAATLVGALPFEGIKFGANEFFRQRLPHGSDGRPLPLYALLAGAVAGTLAHVLTHPLDTVRRRMQISGAAGSDLVYTGMADCVRQVVSSEGVGALFLGIAPTVVRAAPNLGIQFLLYELLKGSLGLL